MERIKTEEEKLEKLEQQVAECGRLDAKDGEDFSGLQKQYEQMLRDAEPLSALQKIQAALETIEQRRRGRATIRQGLEEQAKFSRARIAELERERFLDGVPHRVAAIREAAATLTHGLLARFEVFAREVNEDIQEPARVLQTESHKHTGKRELTTERLAGRLQAFVTEWVGQGRKILEDIHREAQR